MRKSGFKFPLLILLLGLMVAVPARGAEKAQQNFKLDVPKPGKKGNLFNLFFEAAPKLPTDHGTLIIDAFFDKNGNSRRDPGELDLRKEISCRVDGIDYPVPAFIPGLKYNERYRVVCSGTRFHPVRGTRNVLIAERGEIIKIDLACKRALQKTANAKAEPEPPSFSLPKKRLPPEGR